MYAIFYFDYSLCIVLFYLGINLTFLLHIKDRLYIFWSDTYDI